MSLQRYYAKNYKEYREATEFINNHPAAHLLEITDASLSFFAFPNRLSDVGIVSRAR